MTLRRLKTNNSKQDYFDPTVDVVAFPDVVPVGEKLEEINIYLEGIYDDNYLEDIENIFTKLSNQRNELKNFFKKYDNKIKIPQTPLRGKNVSRLNIMKSKIEERQKSLQQKSSFIRSRINITDHCSTVQPNNMTNTRRMESIDNNIINSNRNSRKRKSSSVPGISVEDQIKAFAQADLRRKFLLDEKVKKIKIDREEKVKKIKKNIQKQNILKIQNQHDISCQTDTVSLDYNCANLQNDNRKEDNIKIGENIDLKMNFRKRRSNDDVFVKPIVPAKNSRLTKYPNDHHIDSEKSTTHKTEDIKKHKRKSLLSEKEHYIVENITDCEVTDDENNPAGIVPKWAKFENLKESLIHQNRRFNNNLAELSTSLNLDVINTSMVNLNNKKETLIKIDCFLNVHNIKNVIQNLKNNNILEIDILQQYVKIFIKVMKSLKDQKSREMRSFSDTNIVTKSKKIDKNFYFKQEFTQFLKQNGTLFDSSKDKLSSWSMIKKRLLRNSEGKNNNSLLLINKRNKSSKGCLKNSSSSISLGSINVYKEEKITKCWPSEYNKLLKYVEGEMNILFDVYDDYKGVIKKTKVLLSKKQEFRKNVTLSKVFIPNSIKEKYLSTFQKRIELSLNYDKLQKLQLSDSTINNIKKFITYTDLLENTKFRLSKLELLFHQYEIRIIRLFIKINAMHEELLDMNDTYSLTN